MSTLVIIDNNMFLVFQNRPKTRCRADLVSFLKRCLLIQAKLIETWRIFQSYRTHGFIARLRFGLRPCHISLFSPLNPEPWPGYSDFFTFFFTWLSFSFFLLPLVFLFFLFFFHFFFSFFASTVFLCVFFFFYEKI